MLTVALQITRVPKHVAPDRGNLSTMDIDITGAGKKLEVVRRGTSGLHSGRWMMRKHDEVGREEGVWARTGCISHTAWVDPKTYNVHRHGGWGHCMRVQPIQVKLTFRCTPFLNVIRCCARYRLSRHDFV